jgi:hypothetical protein
MDRNEMPKNKKNEDDQMCLCININNLRIDRFVLDSSSLNHWEFFFFFKKNVLSDHDDGARTKRWEKKRATSIKQLPFFCHPDDRSHHCHHHCR